MGDKLECCLDEGGTLFLNQLTVGFGLFDKHRYDSEDTTYCENHPTFPVNETHRRLAHWFD